MTAKEKEQDPERKAERLARKSLEVVIGENVLDLLGRPDAQHWARVRYLWDGHYRVNIVVGEMAAFAGIMHSYFVTVDSTGKILQSSPAIKKVY